MVVPNNGSGNTPGPKAFVTILQFDQQHNFVEVAWQQIVPAATETGTGVPHGYMTSLRARLAPVGEKLNLFLFRS